MQKSSDDTVDFLVHFCRDRDIELDDVLNDNDESDENDKD